jgi:hypothetical protein
VYYRGDFYRDEKLLNAFVVFQKAGTEGGISQEVPTPKNASFSLIFWGNRSGKSIPAA